MERSSKSTYLCPKSKQLTSADSRGSSPRQHLVHSLSSRWRNCWCGRPVQCVLPNGKYNWSLVNLPTSHTVYKSISCITFPCSDLFDKYCVRLCQHFSSFIIFKRVFTFCRYDHVQYSFSYFHFFSPPPPSSSSFSSPYFLSVSWFFIQQNSWWLQTLTIWR